MKKGEEGIATELDLSGKFSYEEWKADCAIDAAMRRRQGLPPVTYVTLNLR